MRVIFFGSGDFGLPTLQALADSATPDGVTTQVVAVVTQPDRPAGRKRQPTATPVGTWATERGLPLHKVENVNEPAFVAEIAALRADASVVIAFGQKLSPPLIDVMGRLAINLHASLLPRYRGAAPINWAMIDHEPTTGVSVIGLAQRMDAGPVYGRAQLEIDSTETAGELHDRLAQLGPTAVGKVLQQLDTDTLNPVTQDENQATQARKFNKSDGTVDFDQPSELVRARIHGLTPWPGCRVMWRSGRTGGKGIILLKRVADHGPEAVAHPGIPVPGSVMRDHKIACQSGCLELVEVQVPGGKVMDFKTFLRGHEFGRGDTVCPV